MTLKTDKNRRGSCLWELIHSFLTFVLGGWNWSHRFHTHRDAHAARTDPGGLPHVAAERVQSEKSRSPCCQRAHLRGWSRECSYDHWQAERLQMCTCQVNKCYRVNNAFIWINLTASVWENSTREHSSFWVFRESYYQQMCLARLACCCQWPAVCLEIQKNTLWCRCWCAHKRSNHLRTHLLPPSKPRNKAAACWLRWRAKAPQPTSWLAAMYGFYSTHSQLITWEI